MKPGQHVANGTRPILSVAQIEEVVKNHIKKKEPENKRLGLRSKKLNQANSSAERDDGRIKSPKQKTGYKTNLRISKEEIQIDAVAKVVDM